MTPSRNWGWKLILDCIGIGGAIAIASSFNCAVAQITPDSTLPNNSRVTTQDNIRTIEGGTQAGSNLFHSFGEFSVPSGGTAFFNNAADIQNIISRVTGKSISDINGLIRANDTANLFLINPNGIIFGQNAQLKIGGSFVASTASSFRFSDGSEFSAINPQAPPLLKVNIIPGLQYGLTQTESQISNAGQLAVAESKSLILHSGTITSTGSLVAPGGTITLEAEGNISTRDIFTGSSPELPFIQSGGAISLISHDGEINTTAGILNSGTPVNGGAITLQAKGNITTGNILSGIILRENNDSLTSLTENGGAISLISRDGEINTTGGFLVSKATNQGGTIFLNTQGNIGIFFLDTSADKLSGGNIDIISNGRVYTKDDGNIYTHTQGFGKSGDINITSRSLVVQGGTAVSASTRGSGKGGNLTVRAVDFVEITGVSPTKPGVNSGLFNLVGNSAGVSATGGDLTIDTERLIVRDGGQIAIGASFRSTGNAGNLTINASEVDITGVAPPSFKGTYTNSVLVTGTRGTGDSGNLVITTKRLIIRDGAIVVGTSASTGKGSDLTINASEFVKIMGAGGSADNRFTSLLSVDTRGDGEAGNLTLSTKKLMLSNGGAISASTFGSKPGGDINIEASDSIQVSGTDIGTNIKEFASGVYAQTFANGQAGNVKIKTGELIVSDRATITVASRSIQATLVPSGILNLFEGLYPGTLTSNTPQGAGGDLDITANSIRLDNKASISAITASGNGGDMTLNLKNLLLLRRNSNISTSAGTAGQGGDGGNITINAPEGFIAAVPEENSDITANAYTGSGGRVDIQAFGIYGIQPRQFQTSLSDITASSEFGVNGTVELNTPDIDPSSGLVNLPAVPVDTQVAQTCTAGSTVAKSSFTITGRGGLPPNPGEALNTDAVQVDLVTLNREVGKPSTPTVSTNPTSPTPARIVEATGWVLAANGDIILTSSAPTLTPYSSWQKTADCRALNQHQGG